LNTLRPIVGALLLALLSPAAVASAVICQDGVTYSDSAANKCPAYRTNTGIGTITQTTAILSGTGDAQTAGSVHYQWTAAATTFPPGCTALNYTAADLTSPTTATRQAAEKARQKCMRWDSIVAGTGASVSGNIAVPEAGAYSITITGLTADTTYTTFDLHKGGLGGAGKISVIGQHTFTTDAEPGGGGGDPGEPGEQLVADSGAAPRYIGTGGSDAADGLTHATRWLSLNKIVCGLPAGTNIGILNTSVFNTSAGNMDICYSSTSSDWGIIGSYLLNGSSQPIWAYDGVRGGTTDQKAELKGGLTDACLDAVTCDFSTAAIASQGLPNGQYDVPITVNANYVEIRNLKLSYWHGNFLHASGNYHHFIAEGVDIYKSGAGGYAITDGYRDSVWRNSEAQYLGLCIQMRNSGLPAAKYQDACPPGTLYATGVLSRTLNGRHLYENNDVSYGVSETWDCIQGSSHVIMRGNRSYGMSSAGWYADGCSDYVAENNISIGSTNQGYSGAGTTGPALGQQGMCIADIEDWQGTSSRSPENYMCRNNLQLRVGGCFGTAIAGSALALSRNVGMWYLGNTCIGAGYADVQNWTTNLARIQRMVGRSNVIDTRSSQLAGFGQAGAQIVYSHNHVYAAFSDTDLNGSNQTTGEPQLVTSYATFDSNTFNPTNWPDFTDARPSPGSPLIDTGLSMEAVVMTWADFGFAATEMADYKSGAITAENWVKERFYCSGSLNETCGATPPKGVSCPAAGC